MNPQTLQPSILSAEHWKMLSEESAISRDVIIERGYRTITDSKELSKLGFIPKQRRTPGLLIPVHGPDGTLALYQ
jgi:hypothetical protein